MSQRFAKRSFLAVSLGTMIEYYDLTLYAVFLPLFAPLFFPSATPYDALVKGFYAALIAALFRPLGGIIFGFIGDRFGRKTALLGSMYGIALATILLGLIPEYSVIGFWAIVAIILTKAVQGFCFGGEYNGAGIYVVEHARNQNEAFIGSMLTATTLVGGLLSSLVGFIVIMDNMPTWSWRFAFLFGGIIGILGILSRKNLAESPQFEPADPKLHNLTSLIKKYPKELLAGLFIGGFATVPFTTIFSFLNPILMTQGIISSQIMMSLNCFIMVIAIVTLLIAGKIADKISALRVMRFACILLILLSFPLLWLIQSMHLYWLLLAEISFVIINEIFLGPANAYLKNLFPMQLRYRGASLSFTIGMSLFGSLCPVVEHFLYRSTGSLLSIFPWLLFIGIGAYISLDLTKQRIATLTPITNLE